MNRDKPWIMRTYSGHSSARASNELYRLNLAKGQTGLSIAFDLPTQTGYDGDDPLAVGEVGKVGVPIAHIDDMEALFDGIPLERDEHVDDDQRHRRRGCSRCTSRCAERRASIPKRPAGHDAERHHQGVPVARHVHLPARAELRLIADMIAYTVDARAEVEPDQRLQLPPAGSRSDAGAGARVRARRRDRDARPVRAGRVDADELAQRRRAHQLLRERRHPLHRGDLQDARVRPAVGRDHARALRRHRPEAAPLPLRRAGQLARPHRGAAREQRAAHRARGARRHAVARRALPRAAAAGVERGARPAAPVGPAVERCASSRSSPTRPTCSSTATSSTAAT